MPYLFGRLYPEIHSSGFVNREFNVLVDGFSESEKIQDFVKDILILQNYLESLEKLSVKINLIIVSDGESIWKGLNVKTVNKPIKKDEISRLVKEENADLFVSEELKFDLDIECYNCEEAAQYIEIFVRGHDIPWSFNDPVWNATWSAYYLMHEDFLKNMYEYYGKTLSEKDKELSELARTFTLRLSNICYTRDKLLFYKYQKSFAKRKKWLRQDFLFESAYFLSHYYLLLWGGLDQIARILNIALNLGIPQDDFRQLGLQKENFKKKIAKVNNELYKILAQEDFTKWMDVLGKKRHYIAHESSMGLSPMLEETKIDERELEKEVDESEDYKIIKEMLPKEMADWYFQSLKETLRISKYKVLTEDIMVIPCKGKKTDDIQEPDYQLVIKPLESVQHDFDNFKKFTQNIFEIIKTL